MQAQVLETGETAASHVVSIPRLDRACKLCQVAIKSIRMQEKDREATSAQDFVVASSWQIDQAGPDSEGAGRAPEHRDFAGCSSRKSHAESPPAALAEYV